jgi:ADP-ribose pyrophosphatase YjhB (NUDIX family)
MTTAHGPTPVRLLNGYRVIPRRLSLLIHDYQEVCINSHGQQWMTAWHPPGSEPSGQNHGSAGICVTSDGQVVLISSDGLSWDLPAGRPQAGEGWEQTLRREVREEACAVHDYRSKALNRSKQSKQRGRGKTSSLLPLFAPVQMHPRIPTFTREAAACETLALENRPSAPRVSCSPPYCTR